MLFELGKFCVMYLLNVLMFAQRSCVEQQISATTPTLDYFQTALDYRYTDCSGYSSTQPGTVLRLDSTTDPSTGCVQCFCFYPGHTAYRCSGNVLSPSVSLVVPPLPAAPDLPWQPSHASRSAALSEMEGSLQLAGTVEQAGMEQARTVVGRRKLVGIERQYGTREQAKTVKMVGTGGLVGDSYNQARMVEVVAGTGDLVGDAGQVGSQQLTRTVEVVGMGELVGEMEHRNQARMVEVVEVGPC